MLLDFRHLRKYFKSLYDELNTKGRFEGNYLIITSLFCPTYFIRDIRFNKRVKILRFKKVRFSKDEKKIYKNLNTGNQPNRFTTKKFQWHKVHLFDKKIKHWKYVFYMDINMHVHHEINKLLSLKPSKKLFARADGFPDYKRKLNSQFDSTHKIYKKLEKNFDLNKTDYFQTGIMFFDTEIIQSDTKEKILNIARKFPISITNEQGVLNLYFNEIKNYYQELIDKIDESLTYYYWLLDEEKIIITKQLRTKYK